MQARAVAWILAAVLAGCGASQGPAVADMSIEEHLRLAAELEQRARDAEWDRRERLEREARQHRLAADALRTEEDRSCGEIQPEVRAACPLVERVSGVEEAPEGVQLTLRPDAPRDEVFARVRCHLGFARSHGHEGMDECPLYVAGVEATLEDDGVVLTASGEDAVAELRRRAQGLAQAR